MAKIDRLGRLVIPMRIRKELNIDENTDLKLVIENGNVIINKTKEICRICDVNKCIDGLPICVACAEKIKKEL